MQNTTWNVYIYIWRTPRCSTTVLEVHPTYILVQVSTFPRDTSQKHWSIVVMCLEGMHAFVTEIPTLGILSPSRP